MSAAGPGARGGWVVGNDVVDLTDPRCEGKAGDARFVARICAAPEAESIRGAQDPDRALWLTWAAKEAAFKVVSKLLPGPPPFEHARFLVTLPEALANEPGGRAPASGREAGRLPLAGEVRYDRRTLPYRAGLYADAVHVVAWSPGAEAAEDGELPEEVSWGLRAMSPAGGGPRDEDWKPALRPRFTDREWSHVRTRASALVRLAAREAAAQRLDEAEGTLEIVCPGGPPGRTPPVLFRRGEPSPLDVSLSHHGRLVAWALAPGPARSRMPSGGPAGGPP